MPNAFQVQNLEDGKDLNLQARRVEVGTIGSLESILFGPTPSWDGRANLVGALRRSMATTGYSDVKEFQRVEVVVAPYHR